MMNAALLHRSSLRRKLKRPWCKELTFEYGSLTPYPTGFDNTNGLNLAVNAAAAIRGNYGFSVGIPDVNPRIGQITAINVTSMEMELLFDVNSLAMADGDIFDIMRTGSNGASGVSVIVSLKYTIASGYQVQISVRTDAPATVSSSFLSIPDAPCMLRLFWKASDAPGEDNGYAYLYVNDATVASLTGVDNDGHDVTLANIGAAAGVDAGTTGTIYFDNIRCRGL